MAGLLLLLTLAAPAPKSDAKPATTEDHPLIGEWVVESHVSSGKPIAKVGKPERITITRDRWKIGAEGMTESCLSLEAGKEPPHIDIWVPVQGDEEESRARGIYKLDGDTLIVCYRLGKERPSKFESLPKSGVWMMTLKRVKK